MTSIEIPILRDENDIREQTEEEVIETLHLALKEAKERLTPVQMAQEILKVYNIKDTKTALSNLRKGKYEL